MQLSLRISLLVILAVLAGPSAAIDQTIALRTNADGPSPHEADPVSKLIAQLGSDDFSERREAEAQIIQLGAAAFDYLEDAQDNPDLEIATQSQYLLHRVPINWLRTDDPEEVRTLMNGYGGVGGRERRQIISQLSDMPNARGLAALSRIAHFELSAKTAKYAALSVLNDRASQQDSAEEIAKTIIKEIGDSPRDSVHWLSLYAKQLQDPGQVDTAWSELIAKEIALLAEDPTRTSVSLVLGLLQFNIKLCQDLSNTHTLFEALQDRIEFLSSKPFNSDGTTALALSRLHDKRQDGIVDFSSRRSTQNLNDDALLIHLVGRNHASDNAALALTVTWVLEQREWDVLPLIEDHYSEEFRQDRLLLYFAAIARANRDNEAEARQYADQAFNLVAFDVDDRNRLGDVLAEFGYHNWAEHEWRFVVDRVPVTSTESMIARRSLANWCLHDRGEDKAAAEILGEVCDAFDKNDKEKPAQNADDGNRLFLRNLRTQRDYFMACHMESQGDFAAQRKYLDAANRRDPEDPDVLIAMYRLKGADEEFRERTERRIARAVTAVEQRIEAEPDEPTWYNHYAWLVSNTRGDFEKAVRHSHKSLELSPDTPSYLDTLGRCYYAAGDYENAVKYQRIAVEKHPRVQVMRKQLELFEIALAKK